MLYWRSGFLSNAAIDIDHYFYLWHPIMQKQEGESLFNSPKYARRHSRHKKMMWFLYDHEKKTSQILRLLLFHYSWKINFAARGERVNNTNSSFTHQKQKRHTTSNVEKKCFTIFLLWAFQSLKNIRWRRLSSIFSVAILCWIYFKVKFNLLSGRIFISSVLETIDVIIE